MLAGKSACRAGQQQSRATAEQSNSRAEQQRIVCTSLGLVGYGWIVGTRRKYVPVGSFAPSMALYGPANPPVPALESESVRDEERTANSSTAQQLNSSTDQQPNSPTAQQPNSSTAQQPNSSTAQQPNSPTAQQQSSKAAKQQAEGSKWQVSEAARQPTNGRLHRVGSCTLAAGALSGAGVCGFAGPLGAMDGAHEPPRMDSRRVPRTHTPPPNPQQAQNQRSGSSSGCGCGSSSGFRF